MFKTIILTCLIVSSLAFTFCEEKNQVPFQRIIKSSEMILFGTVANISRQSVTHDGKNLVVVTYAYEKVKPLNQSVKVKNKQALSFLSNEIISAKPGDKHLILLGKTAIFSGIRVWSSTTVFHITEADEKGQELASDHQNNQNLWPNGYWVDVEQKIDFMKSALLDRSDDETEAIWRVSRQPNRGPVTLKFLTHYINYFTGNISYTRSMIHVVPANIYTLISDSEMIFVGVVSDVDVVHTEIEDEPSFKIGAYLITFKIETCLKGGLSSGQNLYVKQDLDIRSKVYPGDKVFWFLPKASGIGFAQPVGITSGEFWVSENITEKREYIKSSNANYRLWRNGPFYENVDRKKFKKFVNENYSEEIQARIYEGLYIDNPLGRNIPIEFMKAFVTYKVKNKR